MDSSLLGIGCVVKLKDLYAQPASIGMIIEIEKSEFHGDGGWTSMNYTVMMSSGRIIHISESCIESIVE
mgnify:CR=1 FL=1